MGLFTLLVAVNNSPVSVFFRSFMCFALEKISWSLAAAKFTDLKLEDSCLKRVKVSVIKNQRASAA